LPRILKRGYESPGYGLPETLIAASVIDAVISPPEGLVFTSGSSVTLQGSAVAGNETLPVHLQIVATYPDTGRRVVIGAQIF
jgi:hypothetical protein